MTLHRFEKRSALMLRLEQGGTDEPRPFLAGSQMD